MPADRRAMSESAARKPGFTLADLLWHDTIHFAEQTAVRLDGRALTYKQLGREVEALARVLRRHVSPGDRVGLWLQNSFAWLSAFLALNAIGAVSVPVNTRLTEAELQTILRNARVRVLITGGLYRGRNYLDEAAALLRSGGDGMTIIAASDDKPAAEWPVIMDSRPASPPGIGADDLLCVHYTSGTTAAPKGVMLTNRAYLRTAAYVARCQRLTPSSRFISAAPFFHCSGTMHAITVCLMAGCTLNSLSVWDPEWFVEEVRRNRCDVSHMIYYRDVLALGVERVRDSLTTMRIAHDLGTRDYLLRIHDDLGIEGISNLYGMTETAGQFTMWFPDDPLEDRISGNGRPQPGNRVRIGDPATGAPLEPDATGEIQMKGPTITPGYFNRPEETETAFTADGWLRSGDFGRIATDGHLVYVSRFKEIIRVGGENLAPAEVEQALRDACRARQVCVIGIPDARLDEVPAAVVVGAEISDWPTVLRDLRTRLAGFKIPKAVYVAGELPMTATNRVQRAVLKEWLISNRLERVA